jgi:probable F420-dependent oxidoreductase
VTAFSISLPQFVEGDDVAAAIARAAGRAEELGFTGLWTLDSGVEPPLAHKPVLDGLHALTFAAAASTRAKLGIAVIVLPRRNPVLLAKELATIDRLCGGRLIAGVGLGRGGDELTSALGLPGDRPVRRLREGVEVMRALWSGPDASYAGELFAFAGVTLEPRPLQQPGPPIWFGARARPALRRAARLGDGWIGAGSSSSGDFVEQSKILDEELAEAGRDGFPKAKRVYIAVEDAAAVAFERLSAVLDPMYAAPGLTERVAVFGPPEHCAERLRELAAAGAGELLLNPLYDHPRQLEALAAVTELAGS